MLRTLKAAREKHQVTFKGKPVWITTDYSTETLKAEDMHWSTSSPEGKVAANLDYCIQKSYPP
jgi:hypothetical protein